MQQNIGLLNEKPLHAALKEFCALPQDLVEAALEGYVVDLLRDRQVIEIQTANFTAIRPKVEALLRSYSVRIVYPIASEKWIVKLAPDGLTEDSRRKSSKRGQLLDMFRELVSIPRLIPHPGFSFEAIMIQEEELRRFDRKRNWRRRGWGIEERRLVAVCSQSLFQTGSDWLKLIPSPLHEAFTTLDLQEALGISKQLAQMIAYTYQHAQLTSGIGKRGRYKLYKTNPV